MFEEEIMHGHTHAFGFCIAPRCHPGASGMIHCALIQQMERRLLCLCELTNMTFRLAPPFGGMGFHVYFML